MNSLRSVVYSDSLSGKSLHYHDCHQLLYIAEGAVTVAVDGREFSAEAGSLLLFSRLEQHAVAVTKTPYRRYTLELSPDGQDNVSRLMQRSAQLGNRLFLAAEAAEPLLMAMVREFAADAPMAEEMLHTLAEQFWILLYRSCPQMQQEAPHDALIGAVQRELEARFAEPLTLRELADAHHISPSRLSHLFRSITGRAVMDYRNACRLAAAKRELVQTDFPVGDIADRCGFRDASNFSRTFRAATGLTPLQFRAQYR